jgi:hypothetical protein
MPLFTVTIKATWSADEIDRLSSYPRGKHCCRISLRMTFSNASIRYDQATSR